MTRIQNWTATTGSLGVGRYLHTATLLPNGKVLVAGGAGASDSSLASAQVYDPATGTWTATGSLIGGRYVTHRHAASEWQSVGRRRVSAAAPALLPARRSMTRRRAPGPSPAR